MRLLLAALCLAFVTALTVALPHQSDASSTPSFAAESITMGVSDTATLSITGQFGAEHVSHFRLDIAYDPLVVDATPAGCDLAIDDTEGGGGTCDASTPGNVVLEWGKDGFTEGSVEIATLTLNALAPGVSDVTLSVSELQDEELDPLVPDSVMDGTVTVVGASITATPSTGDTPLFDVGEDTVVVGTRARVELTADFGTTRVGNFLVAISFDDDSIEFFSCEGHTAAGDNVQCNDTAPNVVKFAFATGNPDGANGIENLGEIVFGTGPATGTFDLEITVEQLENVDSLALSALLRDGSVTVTLLIQGDLNCDGILTTIDTLIEMRHVAGVPFPTPPGCPVLGDLAAPSFWGDYNCDGEYSTEDTLRLMRVIAGLPLPPILDCVPPGAEI